MTADLPAIARRIRRRVVRMAHDAKAAHVGSALSCVDILVAFYFGAGRIDPGIPMSPWRDRFILSKGHAASALYATLAEAGYFSPDLLATYCQPGSLLAEHPPAHGLPGVEAGTGSLGHGLPIGVGMALASKLSLLGEKHRVFVVVGDAEMSEGSCWEATAFAARHKLDRLCLIVDANGIGGIDRGVDDVPTLLAKLDAFGWHAVEADGHDPAMLADMMSSVPLPWPNPQPLAIVARTVKGWPISFLQDTVLSHYKVLSDGEMARALEELT